jgi:flavin-dependent dehydrogenase
MKVAIVGAGISGLYLGWKLAERGNQVTVFEKKEKIGKEVCSGLFSERILDFIPESQKLIQNQIEYCLIHFPRRTLKIKFSKKFLAMGRFELDNLVADLSRRAGAKIILKSQINSLPEGFDKIIGCDGPDSIIRKSLGLPNPTYRLAIQGFIPKFDNSNYVETWPVKNGFIWKIPRGKEIEYGIIGSPIGSKRLFDEFLKKNNLSLEKINSAIVPQGLMIPSNQKITLCGDAAGLTKPWSGGGVIWGLTAADILLRNFPDFLKYQKAIKKIFSPKIIFSKIVTKMVYFLGFNFPWLLPKNIKIESDFLSRRI